MSFVRVLVVDDFEEFRRFVCSTLQKEPSLQVVGTASDGLEAVQKAEALQPDLIVLDIGLPSLNGIEAAQRIRKLSAESRILFLSQETSPHVVQEAFSLGALGYVVKEHLESELLTAVKAVCQGRHFVSRGLTGHDLIAGRNAHAPDGFDHKGVTLPLAPNKVEISGSHEVQFYSDEAPFLLDMTRFIEAALDAEHVVVVVATESHRKSLLQGLQSLGVNSATAIKGGRFIPLDASETLSKFMEAAGLNRDRFMSTLGRLLSNTEAAAEARQRRVVVFGEMVAVLCAEGRIGAALQLEQSWNELAHRHSFHLRCAYPITEELKGAPYAAICAEHSAVLPAEISSP